MQERIAVMMTKAMVALTAIVVSLSWSSVAMAQSGAAAETTIHGGTLVIAAYLILWVMFGGILLLVLRRQKVLQRELDGLESRIDEVLGTGVDEA